MSNVLSLKRPLLITPKYKAEQERMHRDLPGYGVECLRYVDTIAEVIKTNGIETMLDYGSGKGRLVPVLAKALVGHKCSVEISLYDPAIPEIAESPEPAQLVTCIDVLEHVEGPCTIDVLKDLARVTQKFAFITIGLQPAEKVLSDGRNAHINLRPVHEWMILLLEVFTLCYAVDKGRTLIFVGRPKAANDDCH